MLGYAAHWSRGSGTSAIATPADYPAGPCAAPPSSSKRIGDFAGVGIGPIGGGPFVGHAILAYIDAAWTVVFQGNGLMSEADTQR